ncbi:O-antigen ligase family protein [Zhihengliuella sp.]|uniref:O-antigen ligase family protein n=1 Tax=Zhihengliuella sp. TaxID=1954483 RepID=UPI0028120CF7|nr:O-antigen ligase family protein [Zhihengliuella sp.]
MPTYPIERSIPKTGYYWFSAWALWMFISSAWSPLGARLSERLEDIFLLWFFCSVSWLLLSILPAEMTHRVFNWLLGVGVVYFLLAVAQGGGAQGRLAAPGGGPNVFARIMLLAFLAAIMYLIQRRRTLIAISCASFFAIGAVMSGSRGALLGIAVALLLAFIPLIRRLGAWRILLCVTGLSALGLIVAHFAKLDIKTFIERRYIEQTFEQGYASGRVVITQDAWGMFLENPFIGVGLDGYYALQEVSGAFQYPHNLLLSSGAEGGVIGMVLLLGAWLSIIITSTNARPLSATTLIALVAFLFLVVASFTSGDYYDSRYSWFFGALATIAAQKTAPSYYAVSRPRVANHLE